MHVAAAAVNLGEDVAVTHDSVVMTAAGVGAVTHGDVAVTHGDVAVTHGDVAVTHGDVEAALDVALVADHKRNPVLCSVQWATRDVCLATSDVGTGA